MKEDTIPRRELNSAFTGASLVDTVERNLPWKIKNKVLCIDSLSMLTLISNECAKLDIFQYPRINRIKHTFDKICYISGKKNVANIGTKAPVFAEDINPNSQFARGPQFIKSGLTKAIENEDIIPIEKLKLHKSSKDVRENVKEKTSMHKEHEEYPKEDP